MAEPPAAPGSKYDSPDLDLYCLKCGYNLRGLSGDPRRCPECGHWNPLGELQVPVTLIRQQLHRMETAPTCCVGGVLLAVSGVCGLVMSVQAGLEAIPERMVCCCAPLPLVGVMLWIGGVAAFRNSCMAQDGWRMALWRYHLYSLALVCVVIVSVLMATCLPDWLGGYAGQVLGSVSAVWWPVLLAVLVVGGPWVRDHLRRIIQPLQREVAVQRARERLRARLRRSHD